MLPFLRLLSVPYPNPVKLKLATAKIPVLLLAGGLLALFPAIPRANALVVFQTGFEASEGYSINNDLVGQNGWIGAGSGGNGIVTGFLSRKGQQAYIGFQAPSPNDTNLFVYQPVKQAAPQIQFSVTFAIIDSNTTNRDDFYWSVFNQQGDQLFTLDFNNDDLGVYYYLDDNQSATWSGLNFTNDGAYQLAMALDFSSNRWSATLNGALLATNQPITTRAAPLNLGDIDAVWAVWNPKAPGDNLMVFDNYQISATVPAPQLKILAMTNAVPTLRVSGLNNTRFALEGSTDLTSWLPLKTNTITAGFFDYTDSSATGLPRRFYRARWVP